MLATRLTSTTLTNDDPEAAEKSKLFSSVARLSTTEERTLLLLFPPPPMKNMGFLVSARARLWCCLFLRGAHHFINQVFGIIF